MFSCAETKGTTQTPPILEYPLPAGPFDVVGIDLLQLPRSIQGSIYVLVCFDHFSRFTVLAPLPNMYATTVAHAIVSHLICPYTTPRVLLSDNGTEFKNQALRDICIQFHVQQTFLTLHYPASNGFVERTNREVLRFCATLQDIYRKHGKTGFLTLLLLSTAASFHPQTKSHTKFCMDLRNA